MRRGRASTAVSVTGGRVPGSDRTAVPRTSLERPRTIARMPSPGEMSRREGIAWLVVLPLLLYLLLTGAGAWAGVYGTQFRVVSLVILAVLFVGWAVAAWRYRDARPRTMLAPVILAILAAQLVAAIFSPRPRMAFEYVRYGLILAG